MRPTIPEPWQAATVLAIVAETATAKTYRLRLSQPRPHAAGQHYVVRLTAPDGYRAQRSYSVASPPGGDTIELTVEMLPGGEVSGFLDQVVQTGDQLEVRGPLGYFAWGGATPMLGVAGGSGLVPLMSMLRQARTTGRADLIRLLVSTRGPDELYYASELPGPETTIVYTRRTPAHHPRPAGRFDAEDLAPLLAAAQDVYVCGSPGFCDAVTTTLSGLRVPAGRIRVERFGPSG